MMQNGSSCAKRLQRRIIYRSVPFTVMKKRFRKGSLQGSKPADREKHRSQKLPENFEFLLEQAIQLRKEVPERSVAQIIYILETEGLCRTRCFKAFYFGTPYLQGRLRPKADADVPRCQKQFVQTFLQTAPYDAGPGVISSMDLNFPSAKTGPWVQTYLSSAIDDHSRYLLVIQIL